MVGSSSSSIFAKITESLGDDAKAISADEASKVQSKEKAIQDSQASSGSQDSGFAGDDDFQQTQPDTADTLSQTSEDDTKPSNENSEATEAAGKSGPTVQDFQNLLSQIRGDERSKLNEALSKVFEDFQSQKHSEAKVFDQIFGRPVPGASSDPLPGPSALLNRRLPTVGTSQPDLLCNFCLSREKNAGIIHGRVIHSVCCYPCAKKLYKKKQPCPMCRRKIEKIAEIIPS